MAPQAVVGSLNDLIGSRSMQLIRASIKIFYQVNFFEFRKP